MSLRTFHLFFIVLCIMGADLVGAWALWGYGGSRDPGMLALGIVSIGGGLGLIGYAIHVYKLMERAHIH